MKKFLLPALIALTFSVVPQSIAAQPSFAAGTGFPLGSPVMLFNAQGQALGQINDSGLLFTGRSLSDVVLVRVMASSAAPRSGTAAMLSSAAGRSVINVYGPSGQRVDVGLPGLKTVQWWSREGRSSTLAVR